MIFESTLSPKDLVELKSLNTSFVSRLWENTSHLYDASSSIYEDSGGDPGVSTDYSARFAPYTVLAVCCIVFNILSLMALANIRGHRTVHHILLINLTICDIVGTVLLWMYYNSPLLFPRFRVTRLRHCLFKVIVLLVPFLLSLCCSSLSLLMLAANQYIAICHPLFSQTTITHGSAGVFIAGIWILSAAAASVPTILMLFKTHFEDCVMFASDMAEKSLEVCAYVLAGLILIIIVLYGRIYREVLQCRRRTTQMTCRRPMSGSGGSEGIGVNRRDPSENNYKAFVTTLLLTGTLVVFWLPYMIFNFLSAHINIDSVPDAVLSVKFYFIDFLPMLNFLTDPVIYGIRMREIRRAYRRLLSSVAPCLVRKQSRQEPRGSTMRLTSLEMSIA